MEVYLENMRSLRSYMNDLEEDAAKRSAEEQQQRTAIDAHDSDISLVRAEAKQASEKAELLATTRAQLGIEMAEKQGRIAVLEVECAALKQTLVLLHQEIASTSAQLDEKRLFYTKITGTLTVKLLEQQEWLSSLKSKIITMEPPVAISLSKQIIEGEKHGLFNSEGSLDKFVSLMLLPSSSPTTMQIVMCLSLSNNQESEFAKRHEELSTQLESAHPKLQNIKLKRSALLSETNKVKQVLEKQKELLADFPAALHQMDMKTLEEEYKALQGDKAGEIEYFHSLEEMISEIKGVLDPVKCRCGLEYKIDLDGEVMDIS